MKFSILVVDDERNIRNGLCEALELGGYRAQSATDGQDALTIISQREIDLIITDLRMPRMGGEELLRRITESWPTVPVIILTGHATIESAVQAMRGGAYDFLTKPVNLDRLLELVKRALSMRELVMRYRGLQEELERHRRSSEIIGSSSSMSKIFDVVAQVAPTRASVLITGESGTGKELIADATHNLSNRRDQPLIKVHCAALTETLLESELFGHEKGAFTGAVARKRGRFELAHRGTIFLDEIAEINQNVQVKILRVLQEKRFERVGGEETIEVDTRIISATNRDLSSELAKGTFREDLFYRLNVVNITMPPLRERKEDIDLLTAAFIRELARENNKTIEGIDTRARAALYNYDWPGNVRELRNCIESAIVLSKSAVIGVDDLPPSVTGGHDDNYVRIPIGSTLIEAERELIRSTLLHNNGNKSRSAEILGIGRKTLHRKIDNYHIGAR